MLPRGRRNQKAKKKDDERTCQSVTELLLGKQIQERNPICLPNPQGDPSGEKEKQEPTLIIGREHPQSLEETPENCPERVAQRVAQRLL